MKFSPKFFLGILLVLIVLGLVLSVTDKRTGKNFTGNAECDIRYEERDVRGNSLKGILDSGQKITVAFGFYNCTEIKRGDIVAYAHAGNVEPVIKVVRGIPGDQFAIRNTGDGVWNIFLAGKVLKNSANEPYVLNETTHKLLSGYETSYNGIIPENAFMLLGNLPTGTLDSTRAGLIDKNDILGKIIY